MWLILTLVVLQDQVPTAPEAMEEFSSREQIRAQIAKISTTFAEASLKLRDSMVQVEESSAVSPASTGDGLAMVEEAAMAARQVVAEMDRLLAMTGEP